MGKNFLFKYKHKDGFKHFRVFIRPLFDFEYDYTPLSKKGSKNHIIFSALPNIPQYFKLGKSYTPWFTRMKIW